MRFGSGEPFSEPGCTSPVWTGGPDLPFTVELHGSARPALHLRCRPGRHAPAL